MSNSFITKSALNRTITTTKTQSGGRSCCEICGIFNRLLDGNSFKDDLSSASAFEKYCDIHTPILRWIEREYTKAAQLEAKAGYRSPDYDLRGFRFIRSQDRLPTISALAYKDRPQYSFETIMHEQKTEGSLEEDSFTSVMKPDWINLGIAKTWLKACIAEHKPQCHLPHGVQAVSPAWLIDTVENCLVPGTTNNEFVALSYRWGSSTAPQMSRDVFNQVKIPGGLLNGEIFLTPTVRHAMQVVRGLSERYLWVDAICLAPDDSEQMSQQLQLMGAIYASAKLTIVALDGDANTGLEGVEGERSLPNIFRWKENTNLLLRHHPELSAMNAKASKYFTRGWTYQEYTLSRRKLIFGKQQMHWKCSCAAYHEDLPHIRDEDKGRSVRPRSLEFPNIKQGFSDIREFGILINEYNARELKYPEDAHPAANGFLTYLGDLAFPGGFLFGMPRLYFGISLMWTVEFGHNIPKSRKSPGLARRTPSERDHSILPNTHLPSWSWIGWSGYGVHMLDKEAQFQWADMLLSSNSKTPVKLIRGSCVTIPIAEWYTCTFGTPDTKQPLPRCAIVYEQAGEPPYDRRLWTRHDFDIAIHGDAVEKVALPFGFSGRYVYEHVNLPNKYFWWPLPPSEPLESPSYTNQTPFITSQVKRAWIRAVREVGYNMDVTMDTHLRLLDKNGKSCGWLQFQNNDELDAFSEPEIQEGLSQNLEHLGMEEVRVKHVLGDNGLLELVAICLCKFCDIQKMGHEIQYNEFYGVLWVDWSDGIAYRKGCGYVKKEIWEEQDLEDIDIVLG
ncbi:hypothetical protein FHETE_1174 [Fusarium heterosporum]|uniref:Heterokaryon incompatibility domain-containing protein n=1 Tax=Fusarium heterosporum TaxID=42747 RepID=A0A8H5U2F1_FUSHE|nr:hypothetical protein FHETE_1174 [Fusarium heterosporum]